MPSMPKKNKKRTKKVSIKHFYQISFKEFWNRRNLRILAATGGVLWKKVLKISQISQENTSVGVYF